MSEYKVIFQPLNLLDNVDNLLSDLKHICNNGDKQKIILFIFDDKTSITKKIFEKHNKEKLNLLLKQYMDEKLGNLNNKNNNNPYNSYEKHIKKTQTRILNNVETVAQKLKSLEINFHTKIYTIILPKINF